ncbi:TPA: hypothetical protein ACN32D_004202 [Vibrio parahaemolyticus]|uniref:hypothetical protein n=1 Tax=Vibrio parahaemolyticus TaxID=670 RepID=UPI000B251E91|nr:hypothetical protein [Vibrio parahaemolyticus]EGQ7914607.1 hypothetical protein [Vibrio parahaemolyticus]EHB9911927.1 hypothetical protein [Vibrio parahaemolyticus]EIA1797877.1 hypothetical protein [Vibrio parahaemolyticus]EII2400839.1 hypothetical protein [Vibrio parahaemolyticus]EJC7147993.1 hypothetical protein [Vibrio parahaemolyticus]
MKTLSYTFLLSFSSVVSAHTWHYSPENESANYNVDGSRMASVSIVEEAPMIQLLNMSGMDGCGFDNNPPSSMVDAVVNGNQTQIFTFCQSYQRVYVIATKEEQQWVIGNLWRGHPVTISTNGNIFNIGVNNFQSAVSNMSF